MSKFILFDALNVLSARYDSDFHGARTLTVIDPDWVRPVINITLQPGESFEIHGEVISNSTDEPLVIENVPDMSVDPVYQTIDNPECKIPPEAIEVSEELFYQTMNEQDGIWSLVDDEVVKLSLPLPTIDQLKAATLININADFAIAMNQVVAGYPEKEISSWAKQETEARAYIANNAASTPLIDALSTARGLDKTELVGRIIFKADLFATVSGQLIGKRQGLEDQLNALDETATAEDVEAIVW
jgi:hypothetical protein